jgi:DNA helicase-2/ATP-dependent DNA helicase PcrA
VRNILDFPSSFSPSAQIITLDRNYRSTKPILAAANAVIELAAERFTKNLWSDRASDELPALVSVKDDRDQARFIVERILERREEGIELKAQAVLFRTSHHSAALELELTRRNIPFVKFGGLKFLEAAHVKDLLACLRWVENPGDRVAGFRVLQMLPGVGPTTAGRVLDAIDQSADRAKVLAEFRPPSGASACWPEFVDLVGRLQLRATGWPAELGLIRDWYEHRHDGGDRGGTATAVRGDDSREEPPFHSRSAEILHASAIQLRRPARLCSTHPVYSQSSSAVI